MKYILAFLLCFGNCFGQEKYPRDYFGSPLDIPLHIAGSFGELRSNHFHSGIDFRTQKKEGFPVFATADGFISRINVSLYGYGKCLYIDHPNGFTSVYAHLQSMAPKIQKVVVDTQYSQKSYTLELRYNSDILPVKKGELIGYTGNTGSSSGPHLHFEIRDTKTEFTINPFFFGYDTKVTDTKPPVINGLMVYSLDELSNVNGSQNSINIPLTLQSDGSYLAEKITANGKIGFGLNAHDISDFNHGKNGIYKLDAFLNGIPYYGYVFDTFSFDETKHINCFIDYPKYKETKQRYQKLFAGNIYPESIIKTLQNKGILTISSNLTMNYKIVVHDFHGNQNTIYIPISYGVLPITQPKTLQKTPYFLKSKNEHSYSKDNFSVFIPENTFYEDFFIQFDVKKDTLFLHDDSVAMNNPLTISYDATSVPISDREKMFIANLDNGKTEYNTTFKKENTFSIKVKKLGQFLISKDETAPKIYNPNFKEGENLDEQKTLKISISDEMSGIKHYNAYLNGNWIVMEYETKNNRLTHNLSDAIYSNGRNEFKIIVTDNMGNSSTFESYFFKTK